MSGFVPLPFLPGKTYPVVVRAENAGLIDVDCKGPSTLEPVMCPRCRSMNAFDAIYCSKCSMALNKQAAMKVERSTDEAKGSEEYKMLVERLKRDLGMLTN